MINRIISFKNSFNAITQVHESVEQYIQSHRKMRRKILSQFDKIIGDGII